MDLSVRTETYVLDRRDWLDSEHGTDATIPATLDLATFVEATHFPDGFLKSGTPLGKITASGKYGLYGASPSEVQTINLGAATAGTITIGFDGQTTAAIAFNATAAAVQAALELLSNINPGDVTVTGGPLPGTITLTFGGQYLGQDVPEVVVTPTGLTGGTVTVATTVAGGGAVTDGRETFVGHLYAQVKVAAGATTVTGALLRHGFVKENKLPFPVDAAAKADVKGFIGYRTA